MNLTDNIDFPGKRITVWCVGGAAFLVMSSVNADAIKVTPGMWESEVTMTSNLMGTQTRVDKECLTNTEIDPRQMLDGMPAQGCDFQSTTDGNTLNFVVSCQTDAGPLNGTGSYTVNDDTSVGSVNVSGNMGGMQIEMKIDSKGRRIGDC